MKFEERNMVCFISSLKARFEIFFWWGSPQRSFFLRVVKVTYCTLLVCNSSEVFLQYRVHPYKKRIALDINWHCVWVFLQLWEFPANRANDYIVNVSSLNFCCPWKFCSPGVNKPSQMLIFIVIFVLLWRSCRLFMFGSIFWMSNIL